MTDSEARIAALAQRIPQPNEGMLVRERQRQAPLIKPSRAVRRLEALATDAQMSTFAEPSADSAVEPIESPNV